ncbi:MAG: FmdB family zinc ribbon protein [Chloroflexota bacterium]
MPLYEYQCLADGHRFEARHGMNDEPVKACPECGAAVRRIMQPVGIVFKGAGFYATDSRSGKRSTKPADSAQSSDGASSDKGKETSDTASPKSGEKAVSTGDTSKPARGGDTKTPASSSDSSAAS